MCRQGLTTRRLAAVLFFLGCGSGSGPGPGVGQTDSTGLDALDRGDEVDGSEAEVLADAYGDLEDAGSEVQDDGLDTTVEPDVTTRPDGVSDLDVGVDAIADVESETASGDVVVPLCPIARIVIAEGDEVIPQTNLHLSGLTSTSSNGPVTGFEWTVQQPNGSVSTLRPSAFVAEPTFEANIVGEYVFRLKVYDAHGTTSCSDAEARVVVTTSSAIDIELTWDTPTDADPRDASGADLDLHLLHPSANGAYFDSRFDCYSENPNPEWGVASPQDNPNLDLEDHDGLGPERVTLDVPQHGVRYQVGVYDVDDRGFGASSATVRVYIYGQLRDQWSGVAVGKGDMWDTHYIDWPAGTVTRVTSAGGPKITHNFPVPAGWPF